MPMAQYLQCQPPAEPQQPGEQFYQQSANRQLSEKTVDRYKDTSGRPCTTDIQHSRSESVESQNIEDMEVSPEKSARTTLSLVQHEQKDPTAFSGTRIVHF
jgi:hypothetical protein